MGNKLGCISGRQACFESEDKDITAFEGEARSRSAEQKEPKISVKDFVFSYILGEGIIICSPLLSFTYIISSTLFAGGFGTVTAGLHAKSGNWYAVKEINLNFKSQRKHVKHLKMISNEIKAHTVCKKHPYICTLHHSFKGQASTYLVLDLYVGGDLRYHLLSGVVFTEQTTAFIVTCLASALEFLHRKKILHRDVKPDNIMFDEHGFPSLTDFGICYPYKDLPREQHVCSMSSGTRQYIAPEVLTSTHRHDSSSDFWSLGIVAYELIYGERPFTGGCPADFIEYNEALHRMMKRYDDHSFELKMKCSQQPPLKKTSALKLLLPNRPYLVMPRISIATQTVVSITCRSLLRGLLDARPDQRLNYKTLSKHDWFQAQGCVWEKIVHCEVVPPFVPDTRAIAIDIQHRHAMYNNNNNNKNNNNNAGDQQDRNLVGGEMMQISRPRNRRKKRSSDFYFDDVGQNSLDIINNNISLQVEV